MTKARKITYIAVFCVVAALFALGGVYDMAISDALYAPSNVVARIFEGIGIFPPFIIFGATAVTLFYVLDEKKRYTKLFKVLCMAATVACYFVFGYMTINEARLGVSWLPFVVGAAFAVSFTLLTIACISRVKAETRRKLFVFLLFATIVCAIVDILAVNVLKFIWGRPRYREMAEAGDFTIFAPWYRLSGFSLSGHHSFPSGHTASAGSLFTLCALGEVFPEYKSREKTIAFIAALYTVTMAYSRIVLGAHFLSDVTAGFAIAFITYAVARFVYFKVFPAGEFLSPSAESEELGVIENDEPIPAEDATAEAAGEEPVSDEVSADRIE